MTDRNFKQALILAGFGLNIFGCALALMLSVLISLILGQIGAGIGYAAGSIIWAAGGQFIIYKIAKSYAYRATEHIQEQGTKKSVTTVYCICTAVAYIIAFICTLFWLNTISGFLCGPLALLAVQHIPNKWIAMLISYIIIAALFCISALCAKKGIVKGAEERQEAEAYYKRKEQNALGTDKNGKITHRNYLN